MSKLSSTSLLSKIVYFFPLQLLLVHLKKNQQLLLFWLFLFLAIFGKIGSKYGIPYLFLAPEYLGELSFASYFIVGFALGGFVTAFHISSYIMNGFRFPFLATLSKPFFKYSINNSFIPFLFIISYVLLTYQFLIEDENFSAAQAIYRISAFLIGYFVFISISTLYFLSTNKDFEKLFGKELAKVLSSESQQNDSATMLLTKKENWVGLLGFIKTWRVESYIGSRFRLKLTRPFKHYDREMLSKVFRQNQINASFFEIVVILSILLLGLFKENTYFIMPAGASVILLFTLLIMITSAIRSWIRGWTVVGIIGVLLLLNQLSKMDNFYYENKAYGLDYSSEAIYEPKAAIPQEQLNADLAATIVRLNKWKEKNMLGEEKPKAVFLASNGGGARAAFWSFLALQHLDEATKGELSKKMVLGTGSSGGMVGTSYFRELKIREVEEGLDPYSDEYKYDMCKDILNPIIFTLTMNDALIRTHRFEAANEMHWKDRGYIFEKRLHENTHGLLAKRLGDYKALEENAIIPSLIYTPSIINDSRRLLISSMPLSFMCQETDENIDYHYLFSNNQADSLNFSTVLRMNASFPYVMPSVSLPTKPQIDVFDSGLRDNYGIKTTLNYIYQLKSWLEENTSGIIILEIRDGASKPTYSTIRQSESLMSEILSPFGSLYGNWFEVQDYNNQELISYLSSWYDGEVDILNYVLNIDRENYISLSWHLTTKEKDQIQNSITLKENQKVEKELIELLK